MKTTLTQSEKLKIGERGAYQFQNPASHLALRCQNLGITCWVEKRKAPVTDADKALRTFIDIPFGYTIEYGITYHGKDFDCGDMPRDIGRVTRGIEIAHSLLPVA